MKILITGPHLSGKSTLIQQLVKGNVISVDVDGATVGLDHGIADVLGIPIRLFGTPGLARFKILRRILSEGADGLLFVVDASNPEDDAEARYIWTEISDMMPTVPCIIAANKLDLRKARAPDRLRNDLSFMVGIPVIPTSALEGDNVGKILTSIVMLVVYEWSPLLRAFEEAGGKGFAALAKRLRIKERKLRSYVRWFELRKMIVVDWEKGIVKLPPGITKLLGQWV